MLGEKICCPQFHSWGGALFSTLEDLEADPIDEKKPMSISTEINI